MTEIILGLLAIAAAAGIASGLTAGLVPFPLGHGAVAFTALLGVVLVLRGCYRLARRRGHGNAYEQRSAGLAATVAGITVVVALAMPSLSETLNLITVGGFPLGLYMLGQGTLILFVALLFIHAARQSRIDAGDP